MKKASFLLNSFAVLITVLASANAGTFTTIAVNGDADTAINAGKSYTHAVDLNRGSNTTINGVTFLDGGNVGANYTLATATNSFTGFGNGASGNLNNLLQDFLFTGDGSGNASLQLNGLTPGQKYITTFYNAQFGPVGGRQVTISGSDGGSPVTIDQNANNQGLIRYSYTAPGTSVTLSFDAVSNNDSFHHYGFSNESDASGTFTTGNLTGDGDVNLSPTNPYSHKVDVGRSIGSGNNVINGLVFSPDNNVGYSFTGATNQLSGNTNNVTGNIGVAMNDFRYGEAGQGISTLTLTGLKPGVDYHLALYNRGYSTTRNVNVMTTDGGFITNFNEDGNGVGNGTRLDYYYKAVSSTQTLTIDAASNGDTYHFYAFSNEILSTVPITGLFNTGKDTNGAPLPNGTIGDPHWSLVSVPSGSSTVSVRPASIPAPPWLGDSADSSWIGPDNDAVLNGPGGDYTYRTTFDLSSVLQTGNPSGRIIGRVSVDDTVQIFLNGLLVGSGAGYSGWSPFDINTGFINGINTLDFVVNNGSFGPTGLRVEFTSALVGVPEPASAALLAIGYVGLVSALRRRKSRR